MQFEDFAPVIPEINQEITINEDKVRDNFNRLYSLNLNSKIENRNGLSYVSWADAVAEFRKIHPAFTYVVLKNPSTNLPYFSDPNLGIMVYTEVTADNLTQQMWLPVMDSSHKAMKEQSYTYQVWDKTNKRYVEKKVEAATMFDINKTIMRCLVKNLAMFGLGLYLYTKEDMPEQIISPVETIESPVADIPNVPFLQDEPPQKQTRRRKSATPPADPNAGMREMINSMTTVSDLVALYKMNALEISQKPEILAMFSKRRAELEQDAA